jgi:ElaB/YqjD/DUF883 family membrane-anchored ribosome-binding protein
MKTNDNPPSAVANETIDELRTLILEAEQALANAGDAADDKLVEVKERLQTALDQGKSTIHRFRRIAVGQVKKADETVRSHPYESLGIALGVGLILGYALSPSRR